jgi:hypothetical protein
MLDAPAGKLGFNTVRGEHFFTGDRRLRLWGVNICSAACFPTHSDADAIANRLAHFGINAVRFHHMDHAAWPDGIFTDDKLETLSPDALDRLDYFIAALKSRGIYADLNLHVSRWWSKAHNWPNADKTPNFDKMIDLFDPDLIAANKQYARDLLTHINAFTHNRYADEPAVAMVEINNEDTFFTWDGEKKLASIPEPYAGMLMTRWKDWRSNQGFSAATATTLPTRASDVWCQFLQQTEQACYDDMRDFLKRDLGVKMPITGTIALGPLGQYTQSHMDFVDSHRYWDHPIFPHKQWDSKDWKIENRSNIDVPQRMMFLAEADRVHGKPFTMTEFNEAAPNEYQAEGIPMIASYAAIQDWDAVFIFDYVHTADWRLDHIANYFDIEGNPLKMAALPFGSRIFLSGAIQPIEDEQIVKISLQDAIENTPRFYQDISGFLTKRLGITADDFLHRRLSVEYTDAKTSTTSPASKKTDSRISWTNRQFIFRDDHARAAVFAGISDGKPIDLNFATITDLKNPFAVIMAVPKEMSDSLDLGTLLIYAASRAQNTGQQWNSTRTSCESHWGSAPVLIDPVIARLALSGECRSYPLLSNGQVARGNPEIGLNSGAKLDQPTLWYKLWRDYPTLR